MSEILYRVLNKISIFSIFVPLLVAVVRSRSLSKPLQLFGLFIAVSSCFDMYAYYTSRRGINNLNALHIYTIVEYALIALFFSLLVEQPAKRIIRYSIYAFSAFAFYYSFFLVSIYEFNSVTRVLECVLLTTMGFYFFYVLFEKEEHHYLPRYPYFWISSGLLLYFMGNTFMFLLYALISKYLSREEGNAFWIIHSLLNIMGNSFYTFGFLCSRQQAK